MDATVHTGHDVIDWLRTDDAERQAARLARRARLGGYDGLAENLVADAQVAMLERMASSTPLEVRNPAGYGTVVIKRMLRDLLRDRDRVQEYPEDDEPGAMGAWGADADGGPTEHDGIRVAIEQLGDARLWLTSATLTYLTLALHPSARPDDAPWPKAGAAPDQARGWPALWIAGVRHLFDEAPDPTGARRQERSRRIASVRRQFLAAFGQARPGAGVDHG